MFWKITNSVLSIFSFKKKKTREKKIPFNLT
nr:MAG TPA: hypothetical protein [Caudoviricetes sp.]